MKLHVFRRTYKFLFFFKKEGQITNLCSTPGIIDYLAVFTWCNIILQQASKSCRCLQRIEKDKIKTFSWLL